jgi:hypothetical protein
MPLIMISCPSTGRSVSTGMAADAISWAALTDAWIGTSFRCPVCNQTHAWSKKDAHLGSATELRAIAGPRYIAAGVPPLL